MAETRDVLSTDIKAAASIPASRLSEITGKLGIQGRASRGGVTLSQFTVAEAAMIVLVRRLQGLGVPLAEAARAVRAIRHDDLHEIVLTDAQRWLVVTAIGAEIADAERVLALAEARGGLEGLRLVSITGALRDIFTAKLERLRAMEQTAEAESLVSGYVAPQNATGCFLHPDLRLCIFESGQGLALRLSPEAARSLAARLLSTADVLEAEPAPEAVN